MTSTHRRVLDRLFSQALDLSPDERDAFLAEACAGDRKLCDGVKKLLAAAHERDNFLAPGGALRGYFGRSLDSGTPARRPERVGPFRIIREIGRGGMSVVYLAEREAGGFDQRVAIKLIKPGADSEQVLRRFGQERQILASLNHPGISRLLDGGWTPDGAPYFAMELVDGLPLLEYCRYHDVDIEQRLALFVAAGEAVAYAHSHQIVHRDLKPSNVMVNSDGQVRLLDFGIAKLLDAPANEANSLTRFPYAPLTLKYASPEQLEGGAVTSASDVYQLGVLLYELLTNRSPYQVTGDSQQDLVKAICEQIPTRPSVLTTQPDPVQDPTQTAMRWCRKLRGDLDTIVMMALRKEPARRYLSAAEIVDDVKRYLAGRPIAARKDAFGYRTQKFLRRHAPIGTAAALAAIGIGALLVSQTWEPNSGGRATAFRGNSVAVLPFTGSRTGEIEDPGAVVAGRLWNELASIPQLQVVARESSFSFQSPDRDFGSIAEQLGVGTIVSGTFQEHERALEITVEVIDGSSGVQLWSRTYDQETGNLLSTQQEIVSDIVDTLSARYGIRLLNTGGAGSATRNPEAYELYLKAQNYYLQRGDGVLKAIELFKRALELDPDFGHAWAGLASAYNSSRTFGPTPEKVDDLIAVSATRAIELNENLGIAYMALGAVEGRRNGRTAALPLLYKAIATSPNDPNVLNASAEVMVLTGRLQDGLQFARRLHEVNPLGPTGGYWVGIAHLMLGNFDAAEGFCDRAWQQTRVRGPIRCSLLSRLERNDLDGASYWVDELAGQNANAWARTTHVYLRARLLPSPDNGQLAIDTIAAAVEAEEIGNDAFYYFATLGDLDRAFGTLNDRLDRGLWVDTKLWWLPSLVAFRQDPRFGPLAEREGIADVWRVHGWADACRPHADRFVCE